MSHQKPLTLLAAAFILALGTFFLTGLQPVLFQGNETNPTLALAPPAFIQTVHAQEEPDSFLGNK